MEIFWTLFGSGFVIFVAYQSFKFILKDWNEEAYISAITFGCILLASLYLIVLSTIKLIGLLS